MTEKNSVKDVDVRGKKVLVRVDYNVPIKEGEVEEDTRIQASLETINYLIKNKAKVILMTHLGRPVGVDEHLRLDPVADKLAILLNREVKKVDETICENVTREVENLKPGEVLLLENLRFNAGEKENDPKFIRKLAKLGDIYINDAFGTSHRAHSSTFGVPQVMPVAVAGFLLERELKKLNCMLENPARPFYTVLGGSKVSDKIDVIDKFLDIVNAIFVGGGMAFTFLKAQGIEIGKSIVEKSQVKHAQKMLMKAKAKNVDFYLPEDVLVTKNPKVGSEFRVVKIFEIPKNWMGVDIGPKTGAYFAKKIAQAKTIFWNGPMGIFEIEEFSHGTQKVAEAIANSSAETIVGGGDSDRALRKFGLEKKISFVSTGGGASLKVIEGSRLPGVEVLQDKDVHYRRAKEAGS